ncbi:MAG: substrate-binding domain-containing protein [Actinobacteria bacterium]|nr:substrate-binding domain-containing protein [Actinomycetota bacterium]
MNTIHHLGRTRVLAVAAGMAVAAFALAGCDSTPSAGTSPSATATATTGAGVAADVQALEQPLKDWPLPKDKVSTPDALKGKTVYYIPITLQAPQFGAAQTAVTEALGTLGATVQVCDGQGTPTTIAACVTQATQAKAGAIIGDAIQYEIAGNAFDAAQAAGIPVILADQAPSTTHPDSKTLATITGPVGNAMDEALAKFAVADSDGKAQVLANVSTDGSSPAAYFASAQKVYDACSGCAVTVNKISSGNFPLVAPSTSAALLKDDKIDYLHVQFAQFLQASEGGVQASGRAASVKAMTGAAQLGELQALKAGTIVAAAGDSAAYEGWVFADAALRLAGGDSIPDYTIPMRLFTANNIGSLDLSTDAVSSGAWFGPANTFKAEFKTLWGVQ